MDLTESLAVVFGLVSVYLTVRQHIWCWPIGIINVGLYVIVFWRTKLYADMALQVLYIVLSVYGWYHWLHGGERASQLPVSRTKGATAIWLACLVAAGAWLSGTLLHRTTDAALPFLDSSLVAASLAAQWMMTRKQLESWLVWIAVDVVYVGMFVFKSLYLTAGLNVVYLGLATMGYVQWRRSPSARDAG